MTSDNARARAEVRLQAAGEGTGPTRETGLHGFRFAPPVATVPGPVGVKREPRIGQAGFDDRGSQSRLEQDLRRYQALARAAQKAAGLSLGGRSDKSDAKGRRRRRPSVRAIKAVRSLWQAEAAPPEAASAVSPPIQNGGS